MCFTRVRLTATSMVAGGALVTGMSAVALTAAVTPSAILDAAHAVATSGQQCAAVVPPKPSPSPTPSSPSPTPTPTSPSPTPSATNSASSTKTAGLDAFRSGGIGAVTELCVSVARSQASVTRGHPASFVVSVWTMYGSAADVTVKLSAAPSSQHGTFTLGCGSGNGSSTCDIGSVDNTSAARQLQAQITVGASDTSVTAASLTATGTATYAKSFPASSASVAETTPPSNPSPHPSNSGGGVGNGSGGGGGGSQSTQLPVGNIFPSLNGNGSSVSNGGSVGGLFPTINPSATPASNHSQSRRVLAGEPAADVVSLGTPVVGAQVVGLIALALAFVLAVTRLSLRRRPATVKGAVATDTSTTPAKDS